MNLAALALGLALVAVLTLDFLFTTVGADERTILSLRLTRAIFRSLRRTARHGKGGWAHRISGPLVMAGLAAMWIFGVSLGWTLVFSAWPGSVAPAPGQPAPQAWDIFAHVGHLLSTLGVGLTEPAGTIWYVIGALVAIHGMLILTLSVSFTLSTTQTVARGRAFAALVEVIDPADPGAFATLAPGLSDLCSSLRSSPFALFYSAPNPRHRLPQALVGFAEAAARSERFDDYRHLLGMLPGFEPGDATAADEFVAAVRAWSATYSMTD